MTMIIEPSARPLPLVIPEPYDQAARRIMWEEARRIYEQIYAETGAPPKWYLLMRNPRFREIVEAENDRILREASEEKTARLAKEAALARKIEDELRRERQARLRQAELQRERVRKEILLWTLTPDGKLAHGMAPKQELEAIGAPSNPNSAEGWMYHMTAFGNLPGIITEGLQPRYGGNSLGACNLAEAFPESLHLPKNTSAQELIVNSYKHSKNVIAASNNRLLSATYVNQREDGVNLLEEAGIRTLPYISVMLRFRNRYTNSTPKHSQHNKWINDPADKRAKLLVGTPIPVYDIEVLTSEGWIPLSRLNITLIRFLIASSGGYDPELFKKFKKDD